MNIRRATPEDVPALRVLIDLSVRALLAAHYTAEQVEAALGTVFGVDSQLIADGTYLLVEADNGCIAGCGGWSKRKTLFGADGGSNREDNLLDPARDNARIRAFFVHPDWSRQGIGSQLLKACETDAAQAGFQGFELGATLAGEQLYSAKGYTAIERIETPLVNGGSLPIIRMSKLKA